MTENDRKPPGTRTKLRHHFLNNLGQVIDAAEIQAVSGGIANLPGHIRHLREEEGFQIHSHVERNDLRPGQYLLETALPAPWFDPAIPEKTRTRLRASNNLHCQMCGAMGGEPDEYDPDRLLRLHIDQTSVDGPGEAESVRYTRVLCSLCHEGVSGTPLDHTTRLNLLAQVRRATGTAQLDVLAWLVRKFPTQAKRLLEALDGGNGG